MTLDWKNALRWVRYPPLWSSLMLTGSIASFVMAWRNPDKPTILFDAFTSGVLLSGAIYNLMVFDLLKLNRELMAERRALNHALHAIGQLRAQEVGEAFAEAVAERGITNVEVMTTKVTKH